MTALSVAQEAAAWLGLPQPTALFAATDAQSVQLRELLKEEQHELTLWPDKAWRKLIREFTFNTVAADVQPNALAADFGRFCDGTIWDRTTDRPVYGPLSPQQWQQEKAGPTSSTVYYGFRLRGNDWLMTPTPAVGDAIYYEYVSLQSVYASGGTLPTQTTFLADTDFSVFPDVLLSRGLRWRFLRAKGMSYSQEYQAWFELVQRFASRDGGMPTLNIQRNYPWTRLSPFIPDGNFPGPS